MVGDDDGRAVRNHFTPLPRTLRQQFILVSLTSREPRQCRCAVVVMLSYVGGTVMSFRAVQSTLEPTVGPDQYYDVIRQNVHLYFLYFLRSRKRLGVLGPG